MYTAEDREQIIDIMDKMSLLRQDFSGAFTWIIVLLSGSEPIEVDTEDLPF